MCARNISLVSITLCQESHVCKWRIFGLVLICIKQAYVCTFSLYVIRCTFSLVVALAPLLSSHSTTVRCPPAHATDNTVCSLFVIALFTFAPEECANINLLKIHFREFLTKKSCPGLLINYWLAGWCSQASADVIFAYGIKCALNKNLLKQTKSFHD